MREMRDLGATKVEVDGTVVVFPAPGPEYQQRAVLVAKGDREQDEKADAEEAEDLLMWSADA